MATTGARAASPVRRLLAGAIDALAVSILIIVLALVGAMILGVAGAETSLAQFARVLGAVLLLGYFAMLERRPVPGTLGASTFRLAVTTVDGQPLGLVRAALRAVAKLLLFWTLPLAWLRADRRALYDLLTGAAVRTRD